MLRPVIQQLKGFISAQEDQARPAVLLVNPQIRPLVRKTLRDSIPNLHVLSTSEISNDTQVESVGVVELNDHAFANS
jgi:flagellar biosynthesis protein FlhA